MTTSALPRLSFLFLCLALSPAAAARQGGSSAASAPAPGAPLSRSVGLRATPGGLRGGGPDYRVELDASGMRFTPALGADAERTFPVTFTLEHFSVGGVPLPCAAAQPGVE